MARRIAWRSPATMLAVAAAWCAQPAQAGEPSEWMGWRTPADKSPDHDRELATSGAIMTGFAVGTLAAGGVTLGFAEHGKEHCGLTGCFRTPDVHARLAGAAMLTGGGAMALVAIPTWLVGRSSKAWERKNNRRMTAGVVLTAAGTGSMAASALLLASRTSPLFAEGAVPENTTPIQAGAPDALIPAIVQTVAGLGMLVPGVVLWSTGARDFERNRPPPYWPQAQFGVSLGGATARVRF